MKEKHEEQDSQALQEGGTLHRHEGGNLPKHGHHDDEIIEETEVTSYWQENLRLVLWLLVIWFLVSFGFSILLFEFLNQFQVFGFKLGFWWAQQGSIYVFVVLIFVYVARMKQIDRKHGVDDDSDDESQSDSQP